MVNRTIVGGRMSFHASTAKYLNIRDIGYLYEQCNKQIILVMRDTERKKGLYPFLPM